MLTRLPEPGRVESNDQVSAVDQPRRIASWDGFRAWGPVLGMQPAPCSAPRKDRIIASDSRGYCDHTKVFKAARSQQCGRSGGGGCVERTRTVRVPSVARSSSAGRGAHPPPPDRIRGVHATAPEAGAGNRRPRGVFAPRAAELALAALGARTVLARSANTPRDRLGVAAFSFPFSYSPASARSAAALSVCSQVNSGSSRPKWP
jgi:hypothetical protein